MTAMYQEEGMAHCQFTYQIQVPVAELLSQVEALARDHNGRFQGDETSGSLAVEFILGRLEGNYTIEGHSLVLTITRKPFLVGCETIDAIIKTYLAGLA